MGKKPEVSLEKRAEINVLLSEGLSQKEIALKLDISQSAVSKIIKRIIEHGTYTPKPRPGRPKVRKQLSAKAMFLKSLTNVKSENVFSQESTPSYPFAGAQEDNFYLSLCEIENSIKNVEDEPKRKILENKNADHKLETEKISHFENSKFQEDDLKTFVKLEGRKIKSEGKRSYNPQRTEEQQHNFTSTKFKRDHEEAGTVEKLTNIYIKSEKKSSSVRDLEERLPHKYMKTEKIFVENDYIAIDNDGNSFYDNANYQSDNEMSNDDQVYYPSFSRRKQSNKKKETEYFKIYNKALKRRYRKSDVQIKPTKFVTISERKRSHDKRSNFIFTSPKKMNFNKKRYY